MEVGCKRRFQRDTGTGRADPSNPFAHWRRDEYAGHFWPHYKEFYKLQFNNAVRRVGEEACIRIDAQHSEERVKNDVMQKLVKQLAKPNVRAPPVKKPKLHPPFAGGVVFEWQSPSRAVGGRWWLSASGMHEKRPGRDHETPESPSEIEFVGKFAFVLRPYKHLYLVDSVTNAVLVYAGKEECVTHVAHMRG